MATPVYATPVAATPVFPSGYATKFLWEFDRGDPADGALVDTYTEEPGDWLLNIAGATTFEIDTAQYLTGSRSMLIHGDGANNGEAYLRNWGSISSRYARLAFSFRAAQTNRLFDLGAVGPTGFPGYLRVNTGGTIRFVFSGGSVDFETYVANIWYLVEEELDFTLGLTRFRVDGGAWTSWEAHNVPQLSIDRFYGYVSASGGDCWIDDIRLLELLPTVIYDTPVF